MLEYPQEFNHIVEKAKSFNRPWQVAVAGANSENILRGVFAAQEEGFAEPILIGNFKKTKEMLDKLQVSISSLQLWIDQKIADGEIEKGLF